MLIKSYKQQQAIQRILAESDLRRLTRKEIRKRLENELSTDLSSVQHKLMIKEYIQQYVWTNTPKKRGRGLSMKAEYCPINKRRRLNNNYSYSMNDDDCSLMLQSLNETDICKLYHIPININQLISQLAMGHLGKCRMNKCEMEILILNKTWKYFDQNENKWDQHNYKLDYFCLKCVENVIKETKKILEESDLTKVTRRDVRNKLEKIFFIDFDEEQWKLFIKDQIRSIVTKNKNTANGAHQM